MIQFHPKRGKCILSAQLNITTATTHIHAARANALTMEFSRSPRAEIKTSANVAGSKPAYSPRTTNAIRPTRIATDPRRSGILRVSPSDEPALLAVNVIAMPTITRSHAMIDGKKPGPTLFSEPSPYLLL